MQPPAPLILHKATLIDATSADPRHNISLELREGRIARIFPAARLSDPAVLADAARVRLVLKAGAVVTDMDGRAST